ncbi:MAG: galactose-1-phosphate uridylyltransferase, partial [Clostridia bacterium]
SKVLPMFSVGARVGYASELYKGFNISIVDWYNSVVRIAGKDKNTVHEMATIVLEKWKNWSDESVGILSKTTDQHNAITPICRLEDDGNYYFDLILRNNRTDNAHPYGIFHAEESLHNIKKEGIGIIEVMGLFILPGRLKNELELIKNFLDGTSAIDMKELLKEGNPLEKHANMIVQLVNDFGAKNSRQKADDIVTEYINKACEKILECTAVFKNNCAGQDAFNKFMTVGLGLRKL